MVLASYGQWIDTVPGPIVFVVTLALAALMVWGAVTHGTAQMRHNLRNDTLHPVTGRMLAALPAPVTRGLIFLVAAVLVAYGVSRVL
jgi:hypothetical protein